MCQPQASRNQDHGDGQTRDRYPTISIAALLSINHSLADPWVQPKLIDGLDDLTRRRAARYRWMTGIPATTV
jgi:hypothetical protein